MQTTKQKMQMEILSRMSAGNNDGWLCSPQHEWHPSTINVKIISFKVIFISYTEHTETYYRSPPGMPQILADSHLQKISHYSLHYYNQLQ